MSQATDPILLDSTGQDIVTGISAVVSAIQSRGMPSPSASNPQMDGTASPGTSNDYARGDHVHPSDTSRVPVYGLGKNLLDNWYFLNAVNQRNIFTVVATNSNVYTLDRWNAYRVILAYGAGGPLVFYASNSGAPTGYVHQWIEKDVVGKQVTASVLLQNGTLLTVSGLLSEDTTLTSNNVGNAEIWVRKLSGSNAEFFIWSRALNAQVKVVAAKLELGTEQTLCHNEGTAENPVWVLNEIPDYEYELYRCITSTADPNDTYANKSLATEQQLAYVESGTTASRAYAVGDYICWNGLLYTANQAISSGTTLSAATNGNLTECVGGGLNNQRIKIQEFPFTTATLGTSFSQTSRAIGTTQNLFGIDATRILSIFVRDSTLTPAANLSFGIWGGTLYMAATQSCTLSDSLPIRIVVTYY